MMNWKTVKFWFLTTAILVVAFSNCGKFNSNQNSSGSGQFRPPPEPVEIVFNKADYLDSIEEMTQDLSLLPADSPEAMAIAMAIYFKSKMYAFEVNAPSCEQLIQENPNMPSGDYTLRINGIAESWRCEVSDHQIVSSSRNSQSTAGANCILDGACAKAPTGLIENTLAETQERGPDNDVILGTDANEHFRGLGGDDSISGGAGNDTIEGGTGNDMINGDAGDDHILGQEGNDWLRGGEGNDAIQGGPGKDLLYGYPGDDYLEGNEDADFLSGGAGHDYLLGGPGHDMLFGNTGNDLLNGEEGNDYFYGGDGIDQILGGPGNDLAYGGTGHDHLKGGLGRDRLHGNEGNDLILGEADDDMVDGGPGNDYMEGNQGNDVLIGGPGNDVLKGGPGQDAFVILPDSDDDIIDGFEYGTDLIDIRSMGLDSYWDLRQITQCYGNFNMQTISQSTDYCVITFSSGERLIIINSPGISRDLNFATRALKIFMIELSEPEQQNRDFVTQIFQKYFSREPNYEGLNYWVGQMSRFSHLELKREIIYGSSFHDRDSMFRNRTDATARQFLSTNNFEIPDWLQDNSDVVTTLINATYQRFFNRNPDPAGLEHWLIHSRDLAPGQFEANIISGSQRADRAYICTNTYTIAREHFQQHAISVPDWLTEARVQERDALVDRIYSDYFSRAPDAAGKQYWIGQLCNRSWIEVERDIILNASLDDKQTLVNNNKQAAVSFFTQNNFPTPNWLNDITVLTYTDSQRDQFIRSVFQKYFNRDPNPSGLEHYRARLSSETMQVQVESSIIQGAQNADRAYVAGYRIEEAQAFFTTNGLSVPNWLSQQTFDQASTFVQSVYNKYFGRAANDIGLRYWVGISVLRSRQELERDIIYSAQSDDQQALSQDAGRSGQARSFLTTNNYNVPSWLAFDTNQARTTINGIFQKYFERTPDAAGMNFWLGQMETKSIEQIEVDIINGAQIDDRATLVAYHGSVARSHMTSQNASIPSWLSLSTYNGYRDFLKALYPKYFGRTVGDTDNGLKYWIKQRVLRSAKQVERDFIYSAQSADRSNLANNFSRARDARNFLNSNNYSIPSWLEEEEEPPPPPHPSKPSWDTTSNRNFIIGVYDKYFNKTPATSGMNYWLPYFASKDRIWMEAAIIGGATGVDLNYMLDNTSVIALSFLKSNGRSIPSILSKANIMYSAYGRYFGRVPGQSGLKYWTDQAESRNIKQVERDLIYSASSSDRAELNKYLSRRYAAKDFLNSNGFSVPSWIN